MDEIDSELPKSVAPGSKTEVVGEYDSRDGKPVFVVSETADDDAWLAMGTEMVRDLEALQ